jgi:hypothetical protein
VVTPVGRPVKETWTLEEKPFWGAIETVMGELALPWETSTELEESVMEKSGWGGGGGGVPPPEPPPPQAAREADTEAQTKRCRALRMARMKGLLGWNAGRLRGRREGQ